MKDILKDIFLYLLCKGIHIFGIGFFVLLIAKVAFMMFPELNTFLIR